MLKGILKYSITALWVIIAELFPSIVCFDKYAIAILLFITPPIAILATGAVRFYRKRSTDSKRLLKSIIFFRCLLDFNQWTCLRSLYVDNYDLMGTCRKYHISIISPCAWHSVGLWNFH